MMNKTRSRASTQTRNARINDGLSAQGAQFSRLALDTSKATQSDDMQTKIIKNISDIFSRFFQANLNNTIKTSTFPEQLKYSDVKSVFKKDSPTNKKNCRPTRILPNVSKIYERCLMKQLEEYFQVLLC